jgi:multiple sugar transport system ATP-binding protein
MAEIQLKQVAKKFGEAWAVKPMDLTIDHGEFVALLGPSGCGKTTTLRMISGLEAVTEGRIYIDGKDVTWLKAAERDIAFVFQFFALYPQMTVAQNIKFPLESQGMKRDQIKKRVDEVVHMLRISHLLRRRPGALSGGDKQRVALARALVRNPACFLMDEPLGALDAEFRENMRAEIKRLHLAEKATTVYVTHDQVEAMAMGDRIVVMSAAVVQQIGSSSEVYYNPANLFVANFIGSPGMNLIKGNYSDGSVHLPGGNKLPVPEWWKPVLAQRLTSDEVIIGFRPEAARVHPDAHLASTVYTVDLHGAYNVLHVNLNGGDIQHLRATRDMIYPIHAPVNFDIDPQMVRFFDPKTEAALPLPLGATTPVAVDAAPLGARRQGEA